MKFLSRDSVGNNRICLLAITDSNKAKPARLIRSVQEITFRVPNGVTELSTGAVISHNDAVLLGSKKVKLFYAD